MAHLRSRRGPALAVPVVVSLTASLELLSTAASAAPSATWAASAADGPNLAHVVDTRTDPRTIELAQRTIARNGGYGFYGSGVVDALRAVK
ncbi:hypothetical protein [Streptomyces sp. NPDC086519]|uniref:hypothetical protein n=1 Tax=Streptomyces sp. NPDC086519 TaxID=3154863 RepID=UPI0034254274